MKKVVVLDVVLEEKLRKIPTFWLDMLEKDDWRWTRVPSGVWVRRSHMEQIREVDRLVNGKKTAFERKRHDYPNEATMNKLGNNLLCSMPERWSSYWDTWCRLRDDHMTVVDSLDNERAELWRFSGDGDVVKDAIRKDVKVEMVIGEGGPEYNISFGVRYRDQKGHTAVDRNTAFTNTQQETERSAKRNREEFEAKETVVVTRKGPRTSVGPPPHLRKVPTISIDNLEVLVPFTALKDPPAVAKHPAEDLITQPMIGTPKTSNVSNPMDVEEFPNGGLFGNEDSDSDDE